MPDPQRASALHVNQLRATTVLAIGAVALLVYLAHAAFIPIALALLFALILSGPVEALHKLRVPRSVSAAVILVIVLSAMAGVVDVMWAPVQQWFKAAPQAVQVVKRKLVPTAAFIAHLEDLASSAESIGGPARRSIESGNAPPGADKNSASGVFFSATRAAIVSTITFVVITLFLLAGGPPMLARMTAAFVDDLNASHVLQIIEKVRLEVGRFYVTTALLNIGFGFATTGAMALCGMPTPYLWGLLATMLNFIPYAGAAATLLVVTLVATVTFEGVGHVLAVSGSYLALATLEGQLIQPLFVGRRLAVNPLLIFLALWFGSLYWGIAGVILATPALLALKVIAEHTGGGKAVIEFMGPNDQKSDEERTFERFLRPVLADAGRIIWKP